MVITGPNLPGVRGSGRSSYLCMKKLEGALPASLRRQRAKQQHRGSLRRRSTARPSTALRRRPQSRRLSPCPRGVSNRRSRRSITTTRHRSEQAPDRTRWRLHQRERQVIERTRWFPAAALGRSLPSANTAALRSTSDATIATKTAGTPASVPSDQRMRQAHRSEWRGE